MKTFIQSKRHKKNWYLINAKGKTLGRLATVIAKYLCGKNEPEYTPNIDTGSYVVVINAKEIKVTGNKLKEKIYYHHTGYQGGIKEISLEKQLVKAPERVLKSAVKGMLPKGLLGTAMLTKLKIYADDTHPHQAHQLNTLTI